MASDPTGSRFCPSRPTPLPVSDSKHKCRLLALLLTHRLLLKIKVQPSTSEDPTGFINELTNLAAPHPASKGTSGEFTKWKVFIGRRVGQEIMSNKKDCFRQNLNKSQDYNKDSSEQPDEEIHRLSLERSPTQELLSPRSLEEHRCVLLHEPGSPLKLILLDFCGGFIT